MDATALRGSFPALVTPLTGERALHLEDLATTVGTALADGATGVLVAGSTGEGTLLGREGRVAVTRAAAHRTRGSDAVLLAGASGATVEELHADVAALAEAGADAVLVLAPHTYPLTPEELCEVHLEVAERAAVPTLAYHIPQLTGSALTPQTLARLADHPGIIGAKDSSPDQDRRAAFGSAVADHDFTLLTGHAPSLARALEGGTRGAVLAIGNLRQHTVTRLLAAHHDRDETTVARLQATLATSSRALAEVPGSTPAVLKAAMQLQGRLEHRWCRPPLRSLSGPALDRVRTALLR